MTDGLHKIYVTCEPLDGLSVLLFLYVIYELENLHWIPALNTLATKIDVDKIVAEHMKLHTKRMEIERNRSGSTASTTPGNIPTFFCFFDCSRIAFS